VLEGLGRWLIITGLVFVALGLLVLLGSRVPLLGRLPGDIHWQRDGFTFYAPLATSLLLSILLSVLLTLVLRLLGRGE
jgi:hypothetical protein